MSVKSIITILLLPFLSISIAVRFFSKKNVLALDQLKTSQCRYNPFSKEVLQFAYFILQYPEYRSVFRHRLGKLLKIITPPYGGQTCLYIRTLSTNIGGGLVINHGHSTEINASKIGCDFHCFQNVTIGTIRSRKGSIIGNNVTVGTGAVVLGEITIGDNVKIGANAIVTKDVPANCTVVTDGTYIIKQNGKRTHIKL